VATSKKQIRKPRKLWTTQDIKQLKQMIRQKVPTKTIARKLGRTLAALYMKASQKGISLGY
jgi:hypothetical protein